MAWISEELDLSGWVLRVCRGRSFTASEVSEVRPVECDFRRSESPKDWLSEELDPRGACSRRARRRERALLEAKLGH